jgi:ankyrin repeat protein
MEAINRRNFFRGCTIHFRPGNLRMRLNLVHATQIMRNQFLKRLRTLVFGTTNYTALCEMTNLKTPATRLHLGHIRTPITSMNNPAPKLFTKATNGRFIPTRETALTTIAHITNDKSERKGEADTSADKVYPLKTKSRKCSKSIFFQTHIRYFHKMWNGNHHNDALYKYNVNANHNKYGRNEEELYRYYKQLIDEGKPSNIKNEITPMFKDKRKSDDLHQLFMLAIKSGNIEKIRVFLDGGININTRGFSGETYFYYAVYTDNADVVNLFLERGADINVVDDDGNTPLHKAVLHSKLNSLRALLERGADINTENASKNTPLISAIIDNNRAIIELLLNNSRLDINHQNVDGSTALHAALDLGNNDIALLLIAHGANLSLANKEGEKPIDSLSRGGAGAAAPINARLASAVAASAWKRRRAAVLARATTRYIPRKPATKNSKRRRTRRRAN